MSKLLPYFIYDDDDDDDDETKTPVTVFIPFTSSAASYFGAMNEGELLGFTNNITEQINKLRIEPPSDEINTQIAQLQSHYDLALEEYDRRTFGKDEKDDKDEKKIFLPGK